NDLIYWDLATFFVGIKKSLFKKKVYILEKDRKLISTCKKIVLNEYYKNISQGLLEQGKVELIILFLELKRILQLMGFQQNQIKRNNFFSYRKLYNFIAYLLLKNEKKRTIKVLDKYLKVF